MTVQPMWIDVAEGGRLDGQRSSQFQSIVDRAIAMHGPTLQAVDRERLKATAARFDSMREVLTASRKDDAFRRYDSAKADALARKDAIDPTAGLFLARDLEHRYAEVLREPMPPLTGFTFPLDTSVPVGARTHTARRLYKTGEVAIFRKGADIPTVSLSQQEETWPVHHFVTSFMLDIFELASSDFAGFPVVAELLRAARDLMAEFTNRAIWYGIDSANLYGITNYPWLAKKVSTVAFDGTATADAMLTELNAIANWPVDNSRATFFPTNIKTSSRVRNILFTTPRASGSDMSVGAWFLANHPTIKSIDVAPELHGVGPGGTDGILAYRNDRLGITVVMPQPFTVLPAQLSGFENLTPCYEDFGGVIMRDVGNNILAWVTA